MSLARQRYRAADFLLFVIFTALVMIISCNYSNRDESSNEQLIRKQATSESGVKENDGSFLMQTATLNMKMQALASMGMQNGYSAKVKEFAGTIEDKHQKMLEQLSTLSKERNISLPVVLNESDKMDLNELTKINAKEFDKRFCEVVIREHKYLLENLLRFADNPQGESVQGFARTYVEVVKGILDEADKCADIK